MDHSLAQDLHDLQSLLEQTLESASQHLNTLDKKPPATDRSKTQAAPLPENGLGAKETLHRFQMRYGDHMAASAGPRYWGFVTGGVTPAALLGDWLASVYDINMSHGENSLAPAVEHEAIHMLRDLFDLPETFHGVFVSGATTANLVGLAAGREWVSQKRQINLTQEGMYGLPPIPVFSAAAHSSVFKVMSILGMGRRHLLPVETLSGNREAINPAALRRQLEMQHGQPCIVVANAGTVNTTDFDDLEAIAALKDEFPFWLHVDAAFGGFAACSPQYQHLMKGIERADSITIDAHKWLNVPYDSAMIFTRHPAHQLAVFRNHAAYLGDLGEQPDFLHLTPENSRRFRALAAWFSLMAYGKSGYQDIVERNCECALALAEKLDAAPMFQLLAPVRMNTVCFTVHTGDTPPTAESIERFLHLLRDDGRVFMTATVYRGTPAIRASLCNWRTERRDVEIAWEALQAVVGQVEESI